MTTQTDDPNSEGPFSWLKTTESPSEESEDRLDEEELEEFIRSATGVKEDIGQSKAQIDRTQDSNFPYLQRQKQQRKMIRQLGSQISEHQESFSNLEREINNNRTEIGNIRKELDDLSTLRQSVSTLQDQVDSMVEQTQQTGINLETADFVYRSVIATGAVFSLVSAIIFAVSLDLFVVSLVLIAIMLFFVYTFKRGLKPINVL